MKRSAAPSVVYRGERADHAPSADQNHLQRYALPVPPRLDEASPSGRRPPPRELNYVMCDRKSRVCVAAAFRKTNREAKTNLDGQGLLVIGYADAALYNETGRTIASLTVERRPADPSPDEVVELDEHGDEIQYVGLAGTSGKKRLYLVPPNTVCIGSYVVTLQTRLALEDYTTGRFFVAPPPPAAAGISAAAATGAPPKLVRLRRSSDWIVPWASSALRRPTRRTGAPLYDPHAPGAVVLARETPTTAAVVVDPQLGSKLRPHQVDGVRFMYACLEGGAPPSSVRGCILADDMGLGKTLQAITIVWTLLEQSAAVSRALVVTPTSLVGNWVAEIARWLGDARLTPSSIADPDRRRATAALAAFRFSPPPALLVVSYEQLKVHLAAICATPGLDLIVCDEGHRLKNAQAKTSAAVSAVPATRRLLLSGTPIQNDLEEFYAMVSFVAPHAFPSASVFRAVYADPIVAMRRPDASDEERTIGATRARNLSELTAAFVLRRTVAINRRYLPARIEHVIMLRLRPPQARLYRAICDGFLDSRGDPTSAPFAAITRLKKVCAGGSDASGDDPEMSFDLVAKRQAKTSPSPQTPPNLSTSKLAFTADLLDAIRMRAPEDRAVIVSNYTSTLRALAAMCAAQEWPWVQLDGSTSPRCRQALVDAFNAAGGPFVFLLSSKAGGCGLNLVGANHLIMFDPDWNPANDAQAMARVWRPGQTKTVYLYRLLATGTIEEKIWQRQIAKEGLAMVVVKESGADAVAEADDATTWTAAQLRRLFTYRGDDTDADTHDLLNCRCEARGRGPKLAPHLREPKIQSLATWQHYRRLDQVREHDIFATAAEALAKHVSFCFLKQTEGPADDRAESPAS